MFKKLGMGITAGLFVAAGVAVAYKLATDEELRHDVVSSIKDAFSVSKTKVSEMTEEVAAKTAAVTKNPEINQNWTAQQWKKVGA